MPHQCTNCGRAFEDGSKEMLSGCPDCGGNKFQFRPDGVDESTPPETDAEPPEPPEPPGSDSTVARTVGKTAATVRDFVGGGDDPGVEPTGSSGTEGQTPTPDTPATETEDAAQASARGDVVGPEELPDDPPEPPTEPAAETHDPDATTQSADAATETDQSEERPDLSELREELNEQFESIKVLEPGQYELNLMELYDREEYIVALEEDGRYSIQVPEAIRD
jgi:predicted  nucleic acid-binding Zn-ribbon protein